MRCPGRHGAAQTRQRHADRETGRGEGDTHGNETVYGERAGAEAGGVGDPEHRESVGGESVVGGGGGGLRWGGGGCSDGGGGWGLRIVLLP